ncbi:MAG: hypothetical protein WBB01_08380 [Phormidesmis sp.]
MNRTMSHPNTKDLRLRAAYQQFFGSSQAIVSDLKFARFDIDGNDFAVIAFLSL